MLNNDDGEDDNILVKDDIVGEKSLDIFEWWVRMGFICEFFKFLVNR